MVRLLNKEINEKVTEIVDFIKNSSSFKNYLKSKNLLEKNEELKELINKIKKYQKEIVNDKSKEKELDLKIQNCLDILNEDPLYLEYLRYLEEVNNYLNIFENKLNKYFFDLFN